MSQINPMIPLSAQMPTLMTPMEVQEKALSMKALMQQSQMRNLEIAQGMQSMKDQQELASLAADGSNIDPSTGGFTPEALTKLTNPLVRQKLNQARMDSKKLQSEIDYKTSEAGKLNEERQTKALNDMFEESYGTYQDVLKRTGNKQAATDAFNKKQAEGYEDLRTTGRGGFSKDTQFRMLTPDDVGAKLISHKERMETANQGKTPYIKETEYLSDLEGQLADLKPNDPGSVPLRRKIAELKAHIAKADALPKYMNNAGGQGSGTPPAPGITKDQEKLSGEDFLKTLPMATANQVRAIGEGRMLLQDVGVRGTARERLATLVNQAYPNYDSGDAKTNRAIEIDFAKGKPAQSLQSINAVTEHMETYRKLARALDNGDTQLFNKYKNAFERATGKTLPNDLSAAAPIVGSEIVKAIVPAGGGVTEREHAEKQWSDALSKKQAESQIDNVYIPLMQGQVDGLRKRYEASGKKDFNTRFLTDGARKSLKIGSTPKEEPNTAPAAALSYLRSHPEAKEQFKAKYGYLPEGM